MAELQADWWQHVRSEAPGNLARSIVTENKTECLSLYWHSKQPECVATG